MKKTIYFGKINISSSQVYDLYNGTTDIYLTLSPILSRFKDGTKYEHEYSFMLDDEIITSKINYSFQSKEITDTYIFGFLNKKNKIPYKTEDNRGELVTKFVDNTERIEIFYDVFKEKIGYYTSSHFGKKEILEVFENMLNSLYDEKEFPLNFSVSKYTHGLSLTEIESELKEIKEIQKLKFTFRPVNPDSDLLHDIQENGKGNLEEFENANLSSKHVELTSASRLGLNLNSNMVKDEISYATSINSNLTLQKSTQNGYVKIEAIGRDGITYSTEDQAQVKKEINNVIDFKRACQDLINRGKL